MGQAPRSDALGAQGRQYDATKILAHLRKWQDRVLDLTKGNPLLGLNRSRVSKLHVIQPHADELFASFVLPDEPALRMPIVRRHAAAQQGLHEPNDEIPETSIEPGDITFDASPGDLARRLRRIYDNARTTIEERGVTTLYLSFGILQWQDEILGESTSPLWMVPCELKATGPTTPLRLMRADEEMQINPALELYLRERHKVKVPSLPEELVAGSLARFLEDTQRAVNEQRWIIQDDVWLSTYTFESLVIYQDLKVMEDVALKHPIVAALARAASSPEASERLGDDLDSMPTPEVVPVSILPTDSSQLETLAYASSGHNLVMHGPPGTGKSQTISNLIADALGMHKKVLFVSAKMAALNVVYQRLAEKGLGRFCLEAHSTKAGKAKIVDELRRILELESDFDGSALSEQLSRLLKARTDLNAYVRDLHRKIAPLDLTPYEGIGKCAALQKEHIPELRFDLPWQDPLSVTKSELESVREVLADLSVQASIWDVRSSHPWRGFKGSVAGKLELQATEADCLTIAGACQNISGWLGYLDPLLVWETDPSLDQVQRLEPVLQALAGVERLPDGWAANTPERLSIIASLLKQAEETVTELASKGPAYRAVLDMDFEAGQELLAPAVTRFSAWHRRLTPSYLTWRRQVRKALKPGVGRDFSKLKDYYVLASSLVEISTWIAEHSSVLAESVGESGLSDRVRLLSASEEYRAASVLKQWQSTHGVKSPEGITALLPALRSAAKGILETLPQRSDSVHAAIERIDIAWPEGFVDGSPAAKASIDSLTQRCHEVATSPQMAYEWLQLQRTLDQCDKLGLTPFIHALGGTSAKPAVLCFERRFYSAWADRAIQQMPNLSAFSGLRHQELVNRFRQLDSEIRGIAQRRIIATASEPAQIVREARADLGSRTEVGILRYELGKRRRIKPLRRLFAEIPHVLQALKPCMLMSPVSVSTYLKPGALEFDVVVFDEASQVPTAEAIPSILRAEQVVVAGDENQLPPTSFFASTLLAGEEPDDQEEEFEPLESLLDDCVAIVPTFQEAFLRWHYRSRDERLIRFSNHYVYTNKLITFPSSTIGRKDSGVRLEFISDGIWDRGKSRTNRREARRVAELIVEQLERHPERSLGVAAMNIQQREAIEDALTEQLADRPDLRSMLTDNQLEPFFVKALENVQGDERDTIIISIGYGKDTNGALTYNFGPLNMEGGWRRLNVLVTRAKWQTILVTSLRSSDLHGVNPQNRGAVALRNYIEYAERGAGLPYDPAAPTAGETNDFEDAVRDALVERGLHVDQQVGASGFRIDLGIRDRRDPMRYVLGVECDGATYHSARTARDRDILRQQVLRDMGWRLHRVWSVDWFRDPQKEVSAVLASLARAESQLQDVLPEVPTAVDQSRPSKESGSNPGKIALVGRNFLSGEPYRKYEARIRPGGRDVMLNRWNVPLLAKRVADVVEVEGPIHVDLIAERLKELHGIERLGSNVQANVDQAIEQAVQKYGLRHDKTRGFISGRSRTLSTFRLPTSEVKRPVHLIAPEELALAILFLVEEQFGVHQDSIGPAVVRMFGFERARLEAADLIREVVDDLVDRGRLRRSGYQLYLP